VHEGRQENAEDIELVLVPKQQIGELIRSNVISHSLVLAAFFYDAIGPKAVMG
jgi:hypothetical protein